MSKNFILAKSHPCQKCGDINWSPTSGRCKTCLKAYAARKYAENPEKYKATIAKYRADNADKIKESLKKYREANKGAISVVVKTWYRANTARHRELVNKWAMKNVEKQRAIRKKWLDANADKQKAANAKWHAKNPDAHRLQEHNRRGRKRANGGKLSAGIVDKLFKAQKGLCPCCRLPLGKNFHIDHIVPLALGGPNEDSNVQLLRAGCNQKKSAKHPVDYMQSKGFLL